MRTSRSPPRKSWSRGVLPPSDRPLRDGSQTFAEACHGDPCRFRSSRQWLYLCPDRLSAFHSPISKTALWRRNRGQPQMTSLKSDLYTVARVPGLTDAQMQGLALVLVDCVEGGASVSFMHPLSLAKAVAFWRRIASDVENGARALLVAEDANGIIGIVQVVFDQPENQPHRADIAKMLVHRRARRLGVGSALLRAAEDAARQSGKSLLVLDTASGDAERLYVRLGWTLAGIIPDYALWPHGGRCSTSIFYRKLD
jgi:GNAT superfamily N-acetyltransferase